MRAALRGSRLEESYFGQEYDRLRPRPCHPEPPGYHRGDPQRQQPVSGLHREDAPDVRLCGGCREGPGAEGGLPGQGGCLHHRGRLGGGRGPGKREYRPGGAVRPGFACPRRRLRHRGASHPGAAGPLPGGPHRHESRRGSGVRQRRPLRRAGRGPGFLQRHARRGG